MSAPISNNNDTTYRFAIIVPHCIRISDSETAQDIEFTREEFYEWIWANFTSLGLVGVHEGTMLSEDAVTEGLETESWTVDSGEAPRERDWVGHRDESRAELYFSNFEGAENASEILKGIPHLQVEQIEKQEPQDWDAQWKASFLNAGAGVEIEPFWHIVPPWVDAQPQKSKQRIKINPGAGFGTGTHETTQLCLKAIGELSQKNPLLGQDTLDFGSGSGILAIGMALLGAKVDAVEIDPLAIDNSKENAELNGVQERITYLSALPDHQKKYSLIIANILRPILIENANSLVNRLQPKGTLILSGLIESDVSEVVRTYQELLGNQYLFKVAALNEWRSIVFYL